MKFLKFTEAKFTEHSLNQQTEFSIKADGEQKAAQMYVTVARTASKWWAFVVKLPLHFIACTWGMCSWPADPQDAIAAFTEKKKAEAEAERAKMIAAQVKDKGHTAPSPENVSQLKQKSKD